MEDFLVSHRSFKGWWGVIKTGNTKYWTIYVPKTFQQQQFWFLCVHNNENKLAEHCSRQGGYLSLFFEYILYELNLSLPIIVGQLTMGSGWSKTNKPATGEGPKVNIKHIFPNCSLNFMVMVTTNVFIVSFHVKL